MPTLEIPLPFGEIQLLWGSPQEGRERSGLGIGAGAVYVFVRDGATWAEQAKLTAKDIHFDRFGESVAVHGDTLAVGAPRDAATYVFGRSGDTWSQLDYLKASNKSNSRFGSAVKLTSDSLIVGADTEDSAAMGVNGSSKPAYYRLRVRTPGTPVVVLDDIDPKSLQLDPITLRDVRVDGRTLLVDVSYSGGCAEHDFQLYMTPAAFAGSSPLQASLLLQHEGNDDACDAIVSEILWFDLTPVLDLHREQYGRDDEIILNVFGFSEDEPGEKKVVRYVP